MNSEITVEMVDQVMERVPDATYKEVRYALVKSEGDVLDAIIILEEDKKNPKKIRKDLKNGTFEMFRLGTKEIGRIANKGLTAGLKVGAKIGEICSKKLDEKK